MLSVPLEARSYQGTRAGVVTRVAAAAVDVVTVAAALVGSYAAWAAFRFMVAPRDFSMPAVSLLSLAEIFFLFLVVYLTVAWWIAGRSLGDHVWGVRVVTGRGGRLGLARAFARAVACAVFPVGLLWCAVDRDRRSLQDLLLRTAVVYDWLARPTGRWGASRGVA